MWGWKDGYFSGTGTCINLELLKQGKLRRFALFKAYICIYLGFCLLSESATIDPWARICGCFAMRKRHKIFNVEKRKIWESVDLPLDFKSNEIIPVPV